MAIETTASRALATKIRLVSEEKRLKRANYNRRMEGAPFSLQQARAMLPQVKHLTAEAVREADSVVSRLQAVPEGDPAHAELSEALRTIVNAWADSIRSLGLEAKGLWLVDFDNGEGYYCWRYPEDTVSHYHGYDEGFAGRIPIQ